MISNAWTRNPVSLLRLLPLVALAAGLMLMISGGPLRAQDGAIEFPENSKNAVATFTADDPEDDTITWSLSGADASAFDISDEGVLTFDSAPDYEAPRDTDTDNTYEVTVVATDTADTPNTDEFAVTVEVTDVAEDGKVSWTVDPDGTGSLTAAGVNGGSPIMQFQVGAALTASVTDGDVSGATKTVAVTDGIWQWYRSSSKTSLGTSIAGETSATYTVQAGDAGNYIHVKAFYNVGAGREESATLASDYPVLALQASNDAPEFDPNRITRKVNEGDKGMVVGAPVTATDDITNALNYTLSGTGADNAKFKIDPKTGQITTGFDLNRDVTTEATADAAGNCTTVNSCVVTVIATDSAGAASGEATVTITLENVDEKPTFTSGPKTITVNEGLTALSGTDADVTYTATDPEGDEISLSLMGADGALFRLGAGGVLSFKAQPDHEKPGDANRDNVYEVTVRASDGNLHEDRMVKVTVTNVNEAPKIAEGLTKFKQAEDRTDAVATFTAEDPEDDTITWTLTGDDAGDFDISKDGVLTFDPSPDYEDPQDADTDNTYAVTVVATDTADTPNTDAFAVTVEVTNVAEDGKVAWTVDPDGDGADYSANVPPAKPIMQFQVGAALTASVTDGDTTSSAAIANPVWQWYRSSSKTSLGTAIDGETSATYTVHADDTGKYIHAKVDYRVGTGREESATLASDYPVLAEQASNDAPEFNPDRITRKVNEGDRGMAVGAPVTATDDITNALNYTLSGTGADNAKFKIDQKTGQITTGFNLNRDVTTEATAEAAGNCVAANSCVVTVIATDSAGAASEVATVTVTLENVDEKPTFGAVDSSATPPTNVRSANYAENATGDALNIASYAATDPEGDRVNLSLMGADGALFKLGAGGVLSFKAEPDHEKPGDANRDNVYEVTVRASDGNLHEDRMVKVTVTNVNEAPEITQGGLAISGPTSTDYAENGTAAVTTYTLAGPNKANARWSLEGDDALDFTIAGGELRFRTSPNYEAPADANTDNTYLVTLKAVADGEMDTHNVTIMVTNVDEDGTVTLSTTSPTVGGELTAMLSDPDGDVTGEMWQWARETSQGVYEDISGATSANYTPEAGDAGNHLRVTVTYSDGHGSGKKAEKRSDSAVVAGDPLVVRYDTDKSGEIEKSEVIAAINDYLDGGEGAPTKANVIKLINLYLGD